MTELFLINLIVATLLSICSFYDLKQKEVPLLPIVIVGIGGILYIIFGVEKISYIAGAGLGILCLLFGKITEESLGYGDGYLLLAIGLLIGLKKNIALLIIALFLSAIFSMVLLILKKGNRKTTIPFVPFLLLSWCIILFE